MTWTLEYDGLEKTFAEWGLGELSRSQVSQATSVARFTQSNATFDGEPLFAIDALVIIRRNGAIWHMGPVTMTPRMGSAKAERLMYEVADLWWYIAQLPYEQTVVMGASSTPTQTTRIVMFADVVEGAVVKRGVQWVIASAVALVVSAGVSMQVAFHGDFGVSPPVQDMRDPTCEEVIRASLKWLPDAIMGWDYSTVDEEENPMPTLRIARRSDATAKEIDLADGETVNLIDITPRDDMRLDKVMMFYEITTTDDEDTFTSLLIDSAGSGSAFRTLKATIPLSGPVITRQKQYIETAPIPTNDAGWWKKRVPHLAEAGDLALVDHVAEPEVEEGAEFDKEIINGAVPGWLDADEVSGSMRVSASADYTLGDGAGTTGTYARDPVSTVVRCTSLSTGTYSRVTSYTEGEAVPAGVAAALHAALSVLQYDGVVRVQQRECAMDIRPGQVLNLANGMEAWATMRATVQQVEEQVDEGVTVIKFGPPKQLGPYDLVEIKRGLRGRPPTHQLDERATGKKEGAQTSGARDVAGANGSGGGNHWKRLVRVDDDKTLTLDVDDGVKVQHGAKVVEIDNNLSRVFVDDGDGKTAEIKDGTITLVVAGNTLAMSPEGITFTSGGASATLNHEGLVVTGGGSTAHLKAGEVKVAEGDESTTMSKDGVSATDGSGGEASMGVGGGFVHTTDGLDGAALSATDGMQHTDGVSTIQVHADLGVEHEHVDGGTATFSGDTGIELNKSSKTVELNVTQFRMSDASGNVATITPEDGFSNTVSSGATAEIGGNGGVVLTDGGSSSVTMTVQSGETITFRSTPVCEGTTNKSGNFLRGVIA